MAKEVEVGIEYVVFWIILALLVVFLAWRTFGHTPTLEAISFFLTAAGVGISWVGLKASFESGTEHKNQTEILAKIQNSIEEVAKSLRKE